MDYCFCMVLKWESDFRIYLADVSDTDCYKHYILLLFHVISSDTLNLEKNLMWPIFDFALLQLQILGMGMEYGLRV